MDNALVNETKDNQGTSLSLLKNARHRIECNILNKSKVIISLENITSFCRNYCTIDNIEEHDDGILISSGNFEVYFTINHSTECTFNEENLTFEFATNQERLYMEFL